MLHLVDYAHGLKIKNAYIVNPIVYVAPEKKHCFQFYDRYGDYFYHDDNFEKLSRLNSVKEFLLFNGSCDFVTKYDSEPMNEIGNYYLNLNSCVIGECNFKMILFRFCGDEENLACIQPLYLKDKSLVIIDGFSSKEVQLRIKKLIEEKAIEKSKCILVNVNPKNDILSKIIPEENIVNYDFVIQEKNVKVLKKF